MTIKVVKETRVETAVSTVRATVDDATKAVTDAVKATSDWVGTSYGKAAAEVAEIAGAVGAKATAVGEESREYMSKLVGQAKDLADSALQAMQDWLPKLPPERQASVAAANGALAALRQAAAESAAPADPGSGGLNEEMLKALAKCQADIQKCQTDLQEGARGGDKASAAAAIQATNVHYELSSYAKRIKDIMDSVRH